MGKQSESLISIIFLFTEHDTTGKILSAAAAVVAALACPAVASALCSAIARRDVPNRVLEIQHRMCICPHVFY